MDQLAKVVYVCPHIDTLVLTDHMEYVVRWCNQYFIPREGHHSLVANFQIFKNYEEAFAFKESAMNKRMANEYLSPVK